MIEFSEAGRAKFERLQHGRIEQVLEISIDGEIVFRPVLRELITGVQITLWGGLSEAEASALVERLASSR